MALTGDLPWIKPIEPTRREPFTDKKWSFELKYDGFRALLYILPKGEPRFISRQDKVLRPFAGLARAIQEELSVKAAILDGELVAKDEADKPQFNDLMRHRRPPSYVAFDIMWLNGEDLRPLPLKERRRYLRRLLRKRPRLIEQSYFHEKYQHEGERMFEMVCQHDFEGVVAKRLGDPYSARTKWYKWINPEYTQLVGRREMFDRMRRTKA